MHGKFTGYTCPELVPVSRMLWDWSEPQAVIRESSVSELCRPEVWKENGAQLEYQVRSLVFEGAISLFVS